MTRQSSYSIKDFSTTVDAEIKRLKAQVELFWEKELRIYKLFGLQDGMRILECGSGPGYVIEKLLTEFPSSHGTALEIDPFLVNILKKTLESSQKDNYKVIQESIMSTGLPDNQFDFIITRLVLEHLPDPFGALQEVKRVLKPGGKAVFTDNDFSIHLRTFPDILELEDLYKAYCQSRVSEGGNPTIGRELTGLLKKSGFVNIDLEIACAHSDIVGDRAFLQSEGVGISSQLVKDGFLKTDKLDAIAKQWHAVLHSESHSFYRQLFIAVGEKSSEDPTLSTSETSVVSSESQSRLNKEELFSCIKEEQLSKLITFITNQVAASLDLSASDIEPDVPLIDLDFDSLSAVDVQNAVKSDLDIDIPASNFFEGQTTLDVANLLLKELSDPSGSNSKQSQNNQESEWDEGEI